VQIAAALGTNAQVIIMDEPTSSLSVRESEHLFELLAKLKKRGITVIYVSHRLEEIFRLCDVVTVLRMAPRRHRIDFGDESGPYHSPNGRPRAEAIHFATSQPRFG